jgi:hypothetical protein
MVRRRQLPADFDLMEALISRTQLTITGDFEGCKQTTREALCHAGKSAEMNMDLLLVDVEV